MAVRYLTADDVLAIAADFFERLGYASPILRGNGRALLESAVHRAQTMAFYSDADVIMQAAALTNGIALSHPFLDGNKRTAFAACLVFLRQNDHPLRTKADRDALAEQLIAQHQLTDRAEADALLAKWLRERLD